MKRSILPNKIKSLINLSILTIFCLAIAGCSNSLTSPSVSTTSAPTQAVSTDTPTPTVTDTPTPTPTDTPTPTPTEVVHGLVEITEDEFSPNAEKYADHNENLTADKKYQYIIDCNRILKVSTEEGSNESTMIELDYPIIPDWINGVFYSTNGDECILFNGTGADKMTYTVAFDVSTGKSLYFIPPENPQYSYTINHAPILCNWIDGINSYVFFPNDKPIVFGAISSRGESFTYLGDYILIEDTIYHYVNEEGVYDADVVPITNSYALYNIKSGALEYTTSFELQSSNGTAFYPILEDDYIYFGYVNYMTEDYSYYKWEYKNDPIKLGDFSFLLIDDRFPLLPTEVYIETEYSFEELIPGPCLESLMDLRERADRLEDTYGLNIFISDECKGLVGGYMCFPENDREDIEIALSSLEHELSKYPEGFFKQFTDDSTYYSSLDICLSSTLKGDGDEYTLDYAGGFRSEIGSSIIIYIDINNGAGINSTLHHELSHAIESKLGINNVDEDYWLSLNPDKYNGSPYSYNYLDWGNQKYYEFIADWDQKKSNDYFIDSYSMTYPTEDRARIFEYVMEDDSWFEFSDYPHILEKLKYWAETIRNGFDTTGWPEQTYWERYTR